MSRPSRVLVPFLLSLGPLWLLLFANVDSVLLRSAGAIGAIGLSVGLILLLSMFYSLQRRIENLEARLEDKEPASRYE